MTSRIVVREEAGTPLPFDLVRAELDQIETLLLQETHSSVGMVREISHHILSAGGKRLRPALLLTAARAVGSQDPRCLKLALCIELLHTATLVHDDVVDHSEYRRGRVTAHQRWGGSASVLTGDVMFAKGMRILVDCGNLEVLDAVTSALITVCEGEVLEIAAHSDPSLAMDTYLRIIDAKTAALIAVCCQVGGIVGGADGPAVMALRAYGQHLGMAFQIMDDLLDLTANTREWGKPIGTDLKEGLVTLPLIYTLQRADSADRDRLRQILTAPQVEMEDIAEAIRLVERYDGLASAYADAQTHVRAAQEQLTILPTSEARDALDAFAEYAVERNR